VRRRSCSVQRGSSASRLFLAELCQHLGVKFTLEFGEARDRTLAVRSEDEAAPPGSAARP
jgi:hypothetical protein